MSGLESDYFCTVETNLFRASATIYQLRFLTSSHLGRECSPIPDQMVKPGSSVRIP